MAANLPYRRDVGTPIPYRRRRNGTGIDVANGTMRLWRDGQLVDSAPYDGTLEQCLASDAPVAAFPYRQFSLGDDASDIPLVICPPLVPSRELGPGMDLFGACTLRGRPVCYQARRVQMPLAMRARDEARARAAGGMTWAVNVLLVAEGQQLQRRIALAIVEALEAWAAGPEEERTLTVSQRLTHTSPHAPLTEADVVCYSDLPDRDE